MLVLNPNHKYFSHGIIAHEALHLVNEMLKQKGVKNPHKDDEQACYLIQYIVDQIYGALQGANALPDLKA